ncbi:MAG TPA: hypothetical protein VJR89_43725 [Polyangiales bacterium]|nr:hypothetical protein [Polyangiales bacterium]
MQSNLRPVVTPAPTYTDMPAGYAALHPLLRALLAAAEQRWTGSAVLRDTHGKLAAVVRCQAGQVVAARAGGQRSLFEAVLPLCIDRPSSIVFASGVDLVGCAPDVSVGRVDPWTLTAAVVCGEHAEDAVAEGVDFIGSRSIIARAKLDFARYVFNDEERSIVQLVNAGPRTVLEIELHTGLPRETVARVVFALWVTRAITLAPAWVRTISRPPPRDDEPTVVAPIEARHSEIRPVTGRYHEHTPAHGVTELCQSNRARADRHFEVAAILLERGYPREAVFEAQLGMRSCQPRPEQEALYAWALYQRDRTRRARG